MRKLKQGELQAVYPSLKKLQYPWCSECRKKAIEQQKTYMRNFKNKNSQEYIATKSYLEMRGEIKRK